MTVDRKAVKIALYYLLVGILTLLASILFFKSPSSLANCSPDKEYDFSGQGLTVKKAFSIEDEIYLVCVGKAPKELTICKLTQNDEVEPALSFSSGYLYYEDIFYSKAADAWIVYSSNNPAENSIEMISWNGEKKWGYSINSSVSRLSLPSEESNQLVVSIEEGRSKALVLDLSDGKVSYENEVPFPSFHVNGDRESELIVTSYEKPKNLSGATLVKTSKEFEPIWTKDFKERLQVTTALHDSHIYTVESFYNRKKLASYCVENGAKEFSVSLSLPTADNTSMELLSFATKDDENFSFAFQRYYKGEPVSCGLLQADKRGTVQLRELEDTGLVFVGLVQWKENLALIAKSSGKNGTTTKVEVLYGDEKP